MYALLLKGIAWSALVAARGARAHRDALPCGCMKGGNMHCACFLGASVADPLVGIVCNNEYQATYHKIHRWGWWVGGGGVERVEGGVDKILPGVDSQSVGLELCLHLRGGVRGRAVF
jgi:hypothetical protein